MKKRKQQALPPPAKPTETPLTNEQMQEEYDKGMEEYFKKYGG